MTASPAFRLDEEAAPVDPDRCTDLLFRLVSPSLAGGTRRGGGAAVFPSDPETWRMIAAGAVEHGLGPLLYRSITSLPEGSASVPEPVRDELRAIFHASRLRSRAALAQLEELLAALNAEGLPSLVLKGPDLGGRVYGEPALRPYRDLDVLLRPDDLAEGAAVLERLGYEARSPANGVDYERHHHMEPLHRGGSLPVELHRRIHDLDSGVRIDMREIWERSERRTIGGEPTRVLSLPDLVIHLTVHAGGNHRFEVPLLSLCDVACLMSRKRDEVEWSRVVDRSRENGGWRFVASVLRVTAERAGIPLPAAVSEELRDVHQEDLSEIVSVVDAQLFRSGAHELPVALQLARRSSGWERWRKLGKALFPGKERLVRMYPGSGRSWYQRAALRTIRIVDLFGRLLSMIWRTLLRRSEVEGAVREDDRRLRVERWVAGA